MLSTVARVLASGSGGQVGCVPSPPISPVVRGPKDGRQQTEGSAYRVYEYLRHGKEMRVAGFCLPCNLSPAQQPEF